MEDTTQQQPAQPEPGSLSWRLSSHPITLLSFLAFRLAPLLVYLFGLLFIDNYILIFIVTTLLLAADFYTVKNIAGRRLVGLRWWNEANPQTGDSTMVFESLDEQQRAARGGVNATDKRFFWLALYAQPVFWILLGVVALVKLHALWLTLVGEFALLFLLRACSGGLSGLVYTRGLTSLKQSLRWSLLSPTRSRSRAATSSARRLVWLRRPCTRAALRGMSRRGCSAASSRGEQAQYERSIGRVRLRGMTANK